MIILGFLHEIIVDKELDIELGGCPSNTMLIGRAGWIVGRAFEEGNNCVDDKKDDEDVVKIETSSLFLVASSIEIVELISVSTQKIPSEVLPMISLMMSIVSMMPMSVVSCYASEKSLKNILKLLELVVLPRTTSLAILRARPILFRTELIIMSAFIGIYKGRVWIRHLFEDFFGTWMSEWLPSVWFLSGWNRSARVRYAFLIYESEAVFESPRRS